MSLKNLFTDSVGVYQPVSVETWNGLVALSEVGTSVQSVSGGTGINITGTSTAPIVNLNSIISVDEIAIGNYSMPTEIGLDNQVLGITGSSVAWITQSTPSDVQSVSAGNSIILTGTAEDPIVNLADDINVLSIAIGATGSNYTLPLTLGLNNQVMGITGSNVAWIDQIVPTDPNILTLTAGDSITITGTSQNPIVNLADNISVLGLHMGSLGADYDLPTVIGTNNYVMTSYLGNCAWRPQPAPTGVETLTAGDNIIIDNTDVQNPIVSLSPDVSISSCTIGTIGTDYVLPNNIGSEGYVLGITGGIANWIPQANPIPTPKTYSFYCAFDLAYPPTGIYYVDFYINFIQDPITLVNYVNILYQSIPSNHDNVSTIPFYKSEQPINDLINGNSTWFNPAYQYQFATTSGFQMDPTGTSITDYQTFNWSIDTSGYIHCASSTTANIANNHVYWCIASYNQSGDPYPANGMGCYSV